MTHLGHMWHAVDRADLSKWMIIWHVDLLLELPSEEEYCTSQSMNESIAMSSSCAQIHVYAQDCVWILR